MVPKSPPKLLASQREESLPFLLGGSEEIDASEAQDIELKSKRVFHCPSLIISHFPILMHILIILLYTSTIFILLKSTLGCSPSGATDIYSPARAALQYEHKLVDGLIKDNVFAMPPNPESNAAWHKMLTGAVIKISAEEMSRVGQTSLAMKDGSGYLATLGVYHELHCIKRLRMWFYRDYYYQNLTQDEYAETWAHTEHCLEFMRQSAICHGDVTITPFRWLRDSQGQIVGPTMETGAVHKCAKWDILAAWAKARAVSLSDTSILSPERQEKLH
ncbi:hypothetical protein F5Y13DRAFT_191588 [Hypoxylon sp. FL1857]|nr:hypothetical protein F5Y13DRAFT_191588 [Hypoxylon sp. FL1857]